MKRKRYSSLIRDLWKNMVADPGAPIFFDDGGICARDEAEAERWLLAKRITTAPWSSFVRTLARYGFCRRGNRFLHTDFAPTSQHGGLLQRTPISAPAFAPEPAHYCQHTGCNFAHSDESVMTRHMKLIEHHTVCAYGHLHEQAQCDRCAELIDTGALTPEMLYGLVTGVDAAVCIDEEARCRRRAFAPAHGRTRGRTHIHPRMPAQDRLLDK